jgi:hypothetical protein
MAATLMPARNLARRLERLEDGLAPDKTPKMLLFEVTDISNGELLYRTELPLYPRKFRGSKTDRAGQAEHAAWRR